MTPLSFYLDEALLNKEVMAWLRVTKEKKSSGITYSLFVISQRSAPVQTPGVGPILKNRD